MIKRLFILTLLLLIIPLVIAVETLGTFQQDKDVELIQVCDNCTYVNLTTVQVPNSSLLNLETNMSRTGRTYNFTFQNTESIGDYIYTTCGDPDGVVTCESVNFKITASGNDLGIAESLVYIIFLGVLIFVFMFFLYGSIRIPFKNQRGDDGKIVSINDMKYLKVCCMVGSYLMLMSIFGIMRQITANYLFLSAANKIFHWMFFFMLSFTFPIIVLSLILILVMFIDNNKIKNALIRGVPLR